MFPQMCFTVITEGGVWFGKSNELYHFDKRFSRKDSLPFQTLIRNVTINNDSILFHGTNFIRRSQWQGFRIHHHTGREHPAANKHRYNNIEFHWAAPFLRAGR